MPKQLFVDFFGFLSSINCDKKQKKKHSYQNLTVTSALQIITSDCLYAYVSQKWAQHKVMRQFFYVLFEV